MAVTYSLATLAILAFHVPYSALMGVISSDSQERTSVCSYQLAVAAGGTLIWQVVTFRATRLFWGRHLLLHFPMAMLVTAPLVILLLYGCFAGTKERVKPRRGQRTPLGRDLKDLFRNTPLLILAGTGFFALVAATLRSMSAILASRTRVLSPYPGPILRFTVITSVCALAAAFLVQYVTKVLGRKITYLSLLVVTLVVTSLSVWVRPDQMQLVFYFYILMTVLRAALMVVIWSMFADTADYSEWKTGRRATGLVFAAASVSQSLAFTLVQFLGNWIFALFGPPAVAAAPQVSAGHMGIRIMVSFVPAVAALLSVVIAFSYPLDEKTLKQMATDLFARRAAEGQPA